MHVAETVSTPTSEHGVYGQATLTTNVTDTQVRESARTVRQTPTMIAAPSSSTEEPSQQEAVI